MLASAFGDASRRSSSRVGKFVRTKRDDRRRQRRGRRDVQAAFHLIEQPMEAICSRGPLAGLGDHQHRFVEVAPRVRHGLRSRLIEPAAILQFVLGVEAEEIRRAHRVIGARDGLRFVMEVGKGEAVLAWRTSSCSRMSHPGYSTASLDADRGDADAERLQFLGIAHQSADRPISHRDSDCR